MNKQEFFDRVNDGANFKMVEEDWDELSTVYAYHPMISDVNGKDEIAEIFKRGGWGIIHDMFPTADSIRKLESTIHESNLNIEKLDKKFAEDQVKLQEEYSNNIRSQHECIKQCAQELAEINERYKSS